MALPLASQPGKDLIRSAICDSVSFGIARYFNMRWVIGDIHGMVKPLEALIRAVEQHDKERQLMFVGDYVNRGPHSREVIDLLLSLSEAYFVRGNHDDVFDHVINNMSFCGKPGEEPRVLAFQWF